MISFAHFPEDRENIIRLWCACFGDARHYIEFFLDNLPSENVLFVYKDEGNIAGMFFLMPADFRYMSNDSGQQQRQPVFYVYAVGVASEYRNHGIAGKMLDFAKNYAYERGAELFLVPAGKKLVSYYGARGFEVLNGDTGTLQMAECEDYAPKINIENMTAVLSDIIDDEEFDRYTEMLYRKREEILQSECALLWSMDNFKFAIKEHIYTGGLVYVSEVDNFEDLEYIICEQKVEKLRIRETLSDGRISGNIDFEIMLTTMSYGKCFFDEDEKKNGVYINFCFN